jgi:hypothetical protein
MSTNKNATAWKLVASTHNRGSVNSGVEPITKWSI